MKKKSVMSLLMLVSLFMVVYSQIPPQMNYQGYLTDNASNPINGNHKLTFTIYDAVSGGNTLWMEEHPVVAIDQGVFRVQLGSIIPLNLAFDAPYWMSIKVENDPELAPRVALSSVPYSFRAVKADSLASMPRIFYRPPWFYLINVSTAWQNARVQVYMGSDQWVSTQDIVAERNVVITGCQMANDDDPNGDTYQLILTRNGTIAGTEFSIGVPGSSVFSYVDLPIPVTFQKGDRIGLQVKSSDGGGEEIFMLLSGYCQD
jgi:hypothetical protein